MDTTTIDKFMSERKKTEIVTCLDKASIGRLYITNERKPSNDANERQHQLECLIHYKIYGNITKGQFSHSDLTDELNQDILQQAQKDYDVVHGDNYLSALIRLLYLEKGDNVNECQSLYNNALSQARKEWKDAGLLLER
jgi:hypothetical protein